MLCIFTLPFYARRGCQKHTSSLIIDAWNRFFPPQNFAALWSRIDLLIDTDRLFAPDEVLHELTIGGDDLYQWAMKRQDNSFVPINEDHEPVVQELAQQYSINVYSDKGVDADPYVIAVAYVRGAIVITEERKQDTPKLKIPNACEEFDIRHISILELTPRERWRF